MRAPGQEFRLALEVRLANANDSDTLAQQRRNSPCL